MAVSGISGAIGRNDDFDELEYLAVLGNGYGGLGVIDSRDRLVSWNVPWAHGTPVCNRLYGIPSTVWLGVEGHLVGRAFEPTSNTLVTTWKSPTGRARARAMIAGSPKTRVGNQYVRQITCVAGHIDAEAHLSLRFGHQGEWPVEWKVLWSRDGITKCKGTARDDVEFTLTTNMRLEWSADRTVAEGRLRLGVGESAFVAVGVKESPLPHSVAEVDGLFDATGEGWWNWLQELDIPDGEDALFATRCVLNLKALGFGNGGSYYAAATRSLPEDDPLYLRAVRCWDYYFDWFRDGGLTVLVLFLSGDRSVLKARYQWLASLPGIHKAARIMYTVDGQYVPREVVIDGMGYRGSVYRYGNDAGDQKQHDVFVYPLQLLYMRALYERQTDLALTLHLAEQARKAMFQPCSGVWEIRPAENSQEEGAKLRVYASAQILNGQALAYAAKIFTITADRLKERGYEHHRAYEYAREKAREYALLAAKVMPWVRSTCVRKGVFVAAPDLPVLDSSILLAFLMAPDMFRDQDREVMRRTAEAIDAPHTEPNPFKGLRVGRGHVRYHTDQFQDGISNEEEGLFTNVTGWLACTFLVLGQHRRAEVLYRELKGAFNSVGQCSEEATPDGRSLGNLSQAYVYQAVLLYLLLRQALLSNDAEEEDLSEVTFS